MISILVYLSIGLGIYLGLLMAKLDRCEQINYGGLIKTIKHQLGFAFIFTMFGVFIILFNMIDRIRNRPKDFWSK